MRTLDYLGLADTPPPSLTATLVRPDDPALPMDPSIAPPAIPSPFLADLAAINRNLNRIRSYSVNAKERYAEEEGEEEDDDDDDHLGHVGIPYSPRHSGTLTPSAASAAAALAATQAQIHQHNLAVQAFAHQASASRPRARTAGVLDSPPPRSVRSYLATPSRLDRSITAADLGLTDGIETLPEAVEALQWSVLGGWSEWGGGGGGGGGQETPTRALWLGNIPASSTVTSLNAIFGVYGTIESARVLTHKSCGFVNFETLESAIQAKTLLHGREIFPGAGPIRIGYAKAPEGSSGGTPAAVDGLMPSTSPEPSGSGPAEFGPNPSSFAPPRGRRNDDDDDDDDDEDDGGGGGGDLRGPLPHEVDQAVVPSLAPLREVHADIIHLARTMGASDDDMIRITASVDRALQYDAFETEIPPVPEPTHRRMHDPPKLREIRKRLDGGSCSPSDVDEIALAMLPEIAELASDYLGNTVVQKLFELGSEPVRTMMLVEIAPHLAEIGVHKNGTWAAQKIIDLAKDPAQMSMIVESLRPYTVPLFLDQYGNYVLQCVLRFGAPWNNFIFESMLGRLDDISHGRFGARAMRACLESHHASKAQQRMLAATIAVYGVPLATDANRTILLTWLLDTCAFPRRRSALAPRLIPHLVPLCTHKVAYPTVLKVINQRNEPDARELVLQALFFSSSSPADDPDHGALEEILRDSGCGATLVFKLLSTPFFEEHVRSDIVQTVRAVLVRLKAQPAQGYKRLMDEVGLSTRGGGGSAGSGREYGGRRDRSNGRPLSQERPRPGSRHRTPTNRTPQPTMEGPYQPPYHHHHHHHHHHSPSRGTHHRDPAAGLIRASSADPGRRPGFEPFGLASMPNAMFNHSNPTMSMSSMPSPSLPYHPSTSMASNRSPAPAGLYPTISPNVSPYPGPAPSIDSLRPGPTHHSTFPSPGMNAAPMYPSAGFPVPTYNSMVGAVMPMPPMNGMSYAPPLPPASGVNRRARVSELGFLAHDTNPSR